MAAAVVLFFILGRYRLPVAILFIPMAAAGLCDAFRRIRNSPKRMALPVAVMLVAGLFANIRVHDEISLNASSLMNVGIAAGKNGDLVNSIRWLRLAVDAFPESAEARFNLGRAYSIHGQPDQAIASYRVAVELRPEIEWANFYMGQACEEIGDRQTAAQYYRRELQRDPRNQRAEKSLRRLQAIR